MAAAFPPIGLWGLCLVALVPLLWVSVRAAEASGRRAWAWAGVWLGVLPLWAYQSWWVIDVTALGYPLMVAALACFPAVFCWLMGRVLVRRPRWSVGLVCAACWTGLEVIRGEVVVTGYAWLLLGHPLIETRLGIAIGTGLGAYAASLAAALVSGLVAEGTLVRGGSDVILRALKVAVLPLVVAGVVLLAGTGGPKPAEGVALRVAVVQTNVPQDNKKEWSAGQRQRDFVEMVELTRRAAELVPRPDVIIWPETMFPGDFLQPIDQSSVRPDEGPWVPPMARLLLEFQGQIGVPLLVGAIGAEGLRLEGGAGGERLALDRRFNSVFLIEGGRVSGERYDKMELTPFGEVIPYVHRWPWLERRVLSVAAGGMPFDLSWGRRAMVFRVRASSGEEVAIATPICFEVTKSSHVRRLAREAGSTPLVLANLSNDGWFGSFVTGKLQHLQIARWRAVEMGAPMVRSVNTGISAFVDERGRVRSGGGAGPGRHGESGVIVAEVRARPARTAYVELGNVAGWASVVLLGVVLVGTMVGGARGKGPASSA